MIGFINNIDWEHVGGVFLVSLVLWIIWLIFGMIIINVFNIKKPLFSITGKTKNRKTPIYKIIEYAFDSSVYGIQKYEIQTTKPYDSFLMALFPLNLIITYKSYKESEILGTFDYEQLKEITSLEEEYEKIYTIIYKERIEHTEIEKAKNEVIENLNKEFNDNYTH